jgi:hypothetical protein
LRNGVVEELVVDDDAVITPVLKEEREGASRPEPVPDERPTNGSGRSNSADGWGSSFIVGDSPTPSEFRSDDPDHSETRENGDADTSEGQQINENPKQVLYESDCVSRV